MYYSLDDALTYNPILLMAISARGGGKSWSGKDKVFTRFLRTGEQFVWVRRYKTELEEALLNGGFTRDIAQDEKYKDVEIKTDSKFCYINGKIAGEFIALSQAAKYKSRSFANTWCVVFDEFIIDTNKNTRMHYIGKNEPELLEDLLNTVFRMRPVRCICLANAITFNNPYFIHYNIRPFKQRFYWDKRRRVLVEMWNGAEYNEADNKSDIATLTSGTRYGDYALNNKFLLDTDTFIEKRTPSAKFMCGVHTASGDIGFWRDSHTGIIYTSFAVDSGCAYRMFTLERDDHNLNTTFLHTFTNTPLVTVAEAWRYGLLRFDDTRVKSRAFDVLAYLV